MPDKPITPGTKLSKYLFGMRSGAGDYLASRKVRKYGTQLKYDLMTQRTYCTQQQALTAKRRLSERLRQQGYAVEGGY